MFHRGEGEEMNGQGCLFCSPGSTLKPEITKKKDFFDFFQNVRAGSWSHLFTHPLLADDRFSVYSVGAGFSEGKLWSREAL